MSGNVRTAVRKALTWAWKMPAEAQRFLDAALAQTVDPRDRAFATRLFYTVLQNGSWIDWQLRCRSRMPRCFPLRKGSKVIPSFRSSCR